MRLKVGFVIAYGVVSAILMYVDADQYIEGHLQAIGFRELNHDGVDPLLSAPGIATFFWLALPLLIGISLHIGWRRWEASRKVARP